MGSSPADSHAAARQDPYSTRRRTRIGHGILVSICLLVALGTTLSAFVRSFRDTSLSPSDPADADAAFAHLAGYCAHVAPPAAPAFLARQRALAHTLRALNASAYVAEPGASAAFFANLSGAAWHLSERPLLLLVAPEPEPSDGARIALLTPQFEAARARMLPVPAAPPGVAYPAWAEDADPYAAAVAALGTLGSEPATIFVDGSARHFIVDGLARAAPHARVLSAPVEVRRLRERKSAAELEILRCVNEATVLAMRAVRAQMRIGMRQSEAVALFVRAMAAAGTQSPGALVLFGDNAARPHGGGADRVLRAGELVLIDGGALLHGYASDVTRTFYLDESVPDAHHVALWHLVHEAQALALKAARAGARTGAVDRAAREYLTREGYGEYFTHRLGHGIGLETHESPYLRGGTDDVIYTGHTFSDEPGIYIENEVGIRLEDCFCVNEDGKAVFLTAGVGGPPRDPWSV